MQELFIDTPDKLQQLCEQLSGSEWLALDTEFLREKTYYSKFCLLQIANHRVAAAVDPLQIDDLSPLLNLLNDPGITKVFHAGRQDLEIFHQIWGTLPAPLFDTQLAATLIGLGNQIGYAALVKGLLNVDLDKGHSRTDWSLRPLSPEQQRYALDDVIYLGQAYMKLNTELHKLGRIPWLADDFNTLASAETYQINPQQQWQRIRGRQNLKGVQLAVLQALAAWRETKAMESDRPKNWIIKDDILLELSRRKPKDMQQLANIRGLEVRTAERHGKKLLSLIAVAGGLPQRQWPEEKNQRIRLTVEQDALADILMSVLRLRAKEQRFSPQALATRKELEQLAIGSRNTGVLTGWRREVIGNDLLKVMEGTLWPQWRSGKIELVPQR
ncbi:Ribonuclease D [hydrothermal vent metagenome]|uniref:Ribonuclease D n=1 Tax=hydrothermal vent metagenome TaxID=652676 RepID=A0A3B1AVV2_9ZZZZ